MLEGHGSKNPRSARRNTLEQAGDRRRMASGKAQPLPSFGVRETGWVAVETVMFTAFRVCGGLHFAASK